MIWKANKEISTWEFIFQLATPVYLFLKYKSKVIQSFGIQYRAIILRYDKISDLQAKLDKYMQYFQNVLTAIFKNRDLPLEGKTKKTEKVVNYNLGS